MGRSNVYTLPSQENGCAHCGDTFERRETGGRPQRFCSPACRVAYHKTRYATEPHRCPSPAPTANPVAPGLSETTTGSSASATPTARSPAVTPCVMRLIGLPATSPASALPTTDLIDPAVACATGLMTLSIG